MAISSMAKPTVNLPNTNFETKVAKGRELVGRRCFVSFSVAVAASLPDSIDSRKALLQEYLERSRRNKAKYDKERLDDYYKRNFEDYFNSVEGSIQGKKDELLTESEKGIREWLLKNK